MSSVKQYRSFLACLLTWILTLCQLVPVSGVVAKPSRPPDTTTSSKNELPSAIPAPAPFTVNITATNFDNYPNAPGPAQPGDTITYNITITNNGNTDATAVTFTDLIDPNTTLVPGSLQTQPMATPDSYNVIGNVRIQPDAANGLLANDSDPDTGNNSGLTAAGPTFSAQGGNVVVNADGSFSYNPNPGFSGHDEFTYTVTDSSGKTDSARVDLNVGLGDDSRSSIAIWFINAAAPAGGDGRLTSPFNCYTGTNSPTQTCFSSSAAQEPGDVIFLYTGNYTGGSTLLDRQILMGQGSSNNVGTIASLAFPIGSDPLPDTHGVSPTITTTNPNTNGINLGVGNNLRGFTVGNTTGAKISGSNFGSLQLGFRTQPDVILTGSGQALNLTNGSFQTTSAFASVTTTSSASQGISLSGIQGTVSLGSTTISGNSSDCILVQSSSADINFGNTTCTGGGNGVHFEANPSGTRIFGTLSVSGVSANAFLHLFNGVTGVGGGNVTITGAANLSSVGDTILVNDPGNTPLIDFQAATSLTSTGTSESADGIDWFSKGTLKFNALSIQSSSGIGIHAQGAGTINVTNNTGSINARQAIEGISIALSANFASTTSSGGPYGIHLNHVTGTSDFGGGSLNGSGSGPAIWIDGGTANLTYGGNMSQTNNKPLLNVTGGHTGTLTFNSGTLSATNGTGLQFDNADGSYNFNGVTTLNGGDAGIDILNDSAGTFNFG
ncbi:MAG TPA: cadherin-like domain-containing protein, partial [Pyrinomonadaceae bacterium]|nr:cadherin-like domain-containing protein [Pyrinomonadaceae bacterium]